VRVRSIWSGTLRTLAVALIAGAAAGAIGLAIAACSPLTLQTRFALAEILFPVLWACGAVWVMAETRLLRAAGVLAAMTALAAALALTPGVCR
jgi:hypothetical protein